MPSERERMVEEEEVEDWTRKGFIAALLLFCGFLILLYAVESATRSWARSTSGNLRGSLSRTALSALPLGLERSSPAVSPFRGAPGAQR